MTVLAVLSTSFSTDKRPRPERQSIVILFETDVHCAIDGYAKIAGLRDAIADTAWTTLVSCGDFMQGDTPGAISHGQYIIDIMRTMNYDILCLGNHEFDYKVPRQLELLSQLKAQVVCCNFTDMKGKLLHAPYVIQKYGKRKVAFVGVLTPETELSCEWYAFHDENGKNIYSLHEKEFHAMVQKAVDAARKEGVDYVVLLSHVGEDDGENTFTSNDLIAATHGIDVVLDGHTHHIIDTVINNSLGKPVRLANTGSHVATVGKLYIGADGRMDVSLIPANEITQLNSKVSAAVEKVNARVKEQTGQVVAHSDVRLIVTEGQNNRIIRKMETNTGDLVADAMRWYADADISFANAGSIRVDLPEGDLTYGDIISLLPFDNMVWKISATGAQVYETLHQNIAWLPGEDGDFPQVSGLRYTATVSDHSISNVEVLQPDGSYAPLDMEATYTVGTTSYVITDGGFRQVLKDCPVLKITNDLYRDVLVQYITTALGGTIGKEYASPQGRITIKN